MATPFHFLYHMRKLEFPIELNWIYVVYSVTSSSPRGHYPRIDVLFTQRFIKPMTWAIDKNKKTNRLIDNRQCEWYKLIIKNDYEN